MMTTTTRRPAPPARRPTKLQLTEFVVAEDGKKARDILAADRQHESSASFGGGRFRSPPENGNGMIPALLILKNRGGGGGVYSETVLKNSLRLFEKCPVFIDGATSVDRSRKSRACMSRFGKLLNARLFAGRSGPEVRADLVYLGSHEMAARLLESLRRELPVFGFHVELETDGENLLAVRSTNLISNPMAGTSLLEQTQPDCSGKTLPAVRRPAVRRPAGRPVVRPARIPTEPKALARWLQRVGN